MTPSTVLFQEPCISKPKLIVLYGSQTGNAKRLAEQITLQAYQLFREPPGHPVGTQPQQCALSVSLLTMDDYKPISRLLTEDGIILFVCSTTGYGIEPDNMSQFWRRLMHRNLKPGISLPPRLRFAVIGLGDSSYPNFNHTSKKLYRRMSQLGASPLNFPTPSEQICEIKDDNALCLLDDQAEFGYDSSLSSWIPCFWKCISEMYNLSFAPEFGDWLSWSNLDSLEFVVKTWPKFEVDFPNPKSSIADTRDNSDLLTKIQDLITLESKPLIPDARLFVVNQNQRVTTEDHFQDTRLISLSYTFDGVPDDQLSANFEPGAVIFIQPQNPLSDVIQLFKLTNSDPNERISIKQRDPNFPIPTVIAHSKNDLCLAWLASYFFDLTACPSKSFLQSLGALARDSVRSQMHETMLSQSDKERLVAEAERLADLCSPEFIEDLNDYVFRPRRTVIEILTDFPITSGFLSPSKWFDILPGPIRARPYSIASAPPSIEILVAVVNYKTLIASPRRGLASNFLASLCPGDCLTGWLSNSAAGSFRFGPVLKLPNPPCLMIAPGTGIAPFRSLLWHQAHVLDPCLPCKNYLFFGCRYSNKDFYFSTEWCELERRGLLKLVAAFSRENSNETVNKSGKFRRTYVQDMLLKYPAEVWSVLGNPLGCVYIVANAKSMPTEVKQSLVNIAQEHGQLSKDEAELHLIQMENDDRMQIEAWA